MKITTAEEARKLSSNEGREDRMDAMIRALNSTVKERAAKGETSALIGMGITHGPLRALKPIELEELHASLRSCGYHVEDVDDANQFFRVLWSGLIEEEE